MEYSFLVSSSQGDEYRILFLPADEEYLSLNVRSCLHERGIDVSELIIDRVSGENATPQNVLHTIVGRISDIFAEHPNLIIFYSCDDCNPIPARNTSGANRNITVQEYRSRLFNHLFDAYMVSHHVSGITNTPIRIDGEGYSCFMHLISRDEHREIVDLVKSDIRQGYAKPEFD